MQFTQLVSIIIPTYNRISFVPETVESIIKQTYPNWEAIIVDDGSTPENFLAIKKIAEQDSRIKLHKRTKLAKGASVCRNTGLELAAGEYVMFLDSDDILASTCLEYRVKQMVANPTLDFCVFQSLVFKDDLKGQTLLWNIDSAEDDLLRFLRKDALWNVSSSLYKKSSLIEIGGFDEHLINWQDYELHTRAIYSDMKYLKLLEAAPDIYVRHHQEESISQKGFKRKDVLLCREEILFGFYNQLYKRNKLEKAHKKALSSSVIIYCKSWIEAFDDLQHANRLWTRVYKSRLINFVNFFLINIYLHLYYKGRSNASIFNKMIRKAISFIIPSYFDKRTFLNKVRYSGYINI